jgi:membrane-anchored mycosin MYCP
VSLGTSKPMLLDEPELPGRTVSVAPGDVGTGVTIGLIDTPFQKSAGLPGPHTVDAEPALKLPAEPVPARAGHGLFVASKILEQAPGAHLIVKGLLDPMTGRGDTWTVAKEMLQLATRVQIMNLSFGSYTVDGEPPLVLTRAIEHIGPDVVVVAAAGNHGIVTGWQNGLTKRSAAWPAAWPDVVAVGARSEHDGLAEFTPRVPWITCTAPGEKVTGAYLTADVVIHNEHGEPRKKHFDGTALWSGTSFATATVSGAIAARMTGGTSARAALTALLADPDPKAVVRKHNRVPG